MLIEGPPIAKGYVYTLRIALTQKDDPVALFPEGCSLRAQVRAARGAASVAGELTTGNGGLVRVSDNAIDVVIPAALTGALPAGGAAHLDLVRTDLDPDAYLGLYLRIPVVQPVTQAA